MAEHLKGHETLATLLAAGHALFKEGRFKEAEKTLEKGLSIDFEHPVLLYSLKCAGYWKAKQERYDKIEEPYDRGEYLLKQWRLFQDFLSRDTTNDEDTVFSIKQWVFGEALTHYRYLLEQPGPPEADILFRLGKCLKNLGDYEQALYYLEKAGGLQKEQPEILAELADTYALVNEIKAAKVFFREAFYLDPQLIDLQSLESLLIRRLTEKVEALGYKPPVREEWIPVYGVIFGVLNIKRELRPLEFGKLKQSIFTLENLLKSGHTGEPKELLMPRLLYRYFWLIDHYVNSKDNRRRIDEVLMKIKNLNEQVYEQYLN